MTTRRERMERRAERRAEWAEKAKAKSAQAFQTAHAATAGIPFGQPILVGHHSEKRHRAAIDRMARSMDRGCAMSDKAADHAGKAANIERALDRSIFSDDANAIEALAAREQKRASVADRMVAINAAWRKAGKPVLLDGREGWAKMIELAGMTDRECDWVTSALKHRGFVDNPQPFPAYAITNARASARRDAKRAAEVEARAVADAKAAEAPGGVLITGDDYCNVRFAEKPAREVIEALKAANFGWHGGAWGGYRAKLPSCVLAMQGEQ